MSSDIMWHHPSKIVYIVAEIILVISDWCYLCDWRQYLLARTKVWGFSFKVPWPIDDFEYVFAEHGIIGNCRRDLAGSLGIFTVNTMRLRQNGHHFADESFKCIFFNEDLRISIKILLKFVPDGSINKKPPSIQIMAYFTDPCVPLHIYASPGPDELSDFHLNCDAVSIDWWVQGTPLGESIEGGCIMSLNNGIVGGLFCPYTDRYSALKQRDRPITNANWFPSTNNIVLLWQFPYMECVPKVTNYNKSVLVHIMTWYQSGNKR